MVYALYILLRSYRFVAVAFSLGQINVKLTKNKENLSKYALEILYAKLRHKTNKHTLLAKIVWQRPICPGLNSIVLSNHCSSGPCYTVNFRISKQCAMKIDRGC